MGRWGAVYPFDDRSSKHSDFSRLPGVLRSIDASVRSYDRSAVRNSAALGRGAERASTRVSTLGAADAGNDGPDGISEAAE